MPGYPVSAIIVFEQLVRPLLAELLGQPETARTTVTVEPTRKIASKLGLEEFVRVKLGEVSGRIVAAGEQGAVDRARVRDADRELVEVRRGVHARRTGVRERGGDKQQRTRSRNRCDECAAASSLPREHWNRAVRRR